MVKTPLLLVAAAIFLLVISCCCCCSGDWWTKWDWEGFEFGTPTPEVTPYITQEPVSDTALETARLLETTQVPIRDMHELAIRLRGIPPNTPRTVNTAGTPDYPVGTRRVFHVSNMDTDEQFDITAELAYKTDHVYMWVEEGVDLDLDDIQAAADLFETETYPTNREFFGSEWTPGVDNDPHLSILHAQNLGSVGGYYSSSDEFVTAVREDSNEMEMFYINVDAGNLLFCPVNSECYNGVLAHEFQHMIHWYNDRNEDTWLNEGFSELASYLNGFDPGGADSLFARNPDNQLNDIDYDAPDGTASYGAAYLFTSYFLDRFGKEATQALVAHPENGLYSVDAVLEELGVHSTHRDLFADWVIANLLDEPGLADGQYGYEDIDPPSFNMDTTIYADNCPFTYTSTVHQYGTDFIETRGDASLRLSFVASTMAQVVNAQPHSGQYLWWGNREDDSVTSLTRAFDLSSVGKATLQFWTWYDIEEDWDYAYVEISPDGGETWEILTTPSGTPTNPNGNSFGWAYTGDSGGWIQEEVDLSSYVGGEVLVRFEYITDDAVNRPGFVLDDIGIPEIGYFSDFEDGPDGWEPAGFIRHANLLPQEWIVQMVVFGPETRVERLALDADRTGEWEVPLGNGVNRVVIAISAATLGTTEQASYSITFSCP